MTSSSSTALSALEIAYASVVTVKLHRSMDGITADATIEEQHTDETVIADHPVERGSVVSDHAYSKPSAVVLTYAFSESSQSSTLGGLAGQFSPTVNPNYLQDMYQKFLTIKNNRSLFDIYTGKRHYQNMLIASISTTTDKRSEHDLILRITCRELLLATTQILTMPDQSTLADPSANAATVNQGTKLLTAAPNFNPTGISP